MDMVVIIALAALGLFMGSFINALVWRLRTKRSFILERSICPKCKHQLKIIDLIPVLSWVSLKGKCRYCNKPISLQYPSVELLTSGLFVLFYANWDFTGFSSYILFGAWLAVLTCLIALAVYDLKWMLLPNKIMRFLLVFSLTQLFLYSILTGHRDVISATLAAMLAGGFFYAMFAYSKGKWMGGGDVKLAFIMGLLLGLNKLAVALLVAFNSAAIIGSLLLLTKKYTKKSLMPFGPFLIAGTITAKLYGHTIIAWYLGLIGWQ
jgi:prepilin signal peptidase PulO-like enzyme (type II secretory pathway)